MPRIEFWSSVEYSSFMGGTIAGLRTAGWEAAHRFTIPSGEYRRTKGRLAWLWLRFRMYLVYPLQLTRSCLSGATPTIRVVSSNTFYAPLLAALISGRRGGRVVHLVYDLFPDALIIAGGVRRGGLFARILGAVTRATLRRCDANVFLAAALLDHARQTHGAFPRAGVISVGADGAPFRRHYPNTRDAERPARFLYCGNLGRMHDTATIEAALLRLADRQPMRWEVVFRGHGTGYHGLRKRLALHGLIDQAATANCGNTLVAGKMRPEARFRRSIYVRFQEPLEAADWVQAMLDADVAIVTMKRGAEAVSLPSKAFSAMVAGQALLAVCPGHSDLASLIRSHDCGWSIEPGDVDGLCAIFESIVRYPAELLRKRRNSYSAGHEVYETSKLAIEWAELFRKMSDEGRWSRAAPPMRGT